MKNLALFDFDGTITTKDTFLEIIKFKVGKGNFYFGMLLLSPFLVAFKLKVYPNWKAKEKVLTYFFKGLSLEKFNRLCLDFSDQKLTDMIRPKAVEAIKKHRENGDEITIVSASAENWVKPWCDKMGLNCIGTKLEVKDGKITGKLASKNCYGPEKVNRVKEIYNIGNYSTLFGYGDSGGDKELLAFVNTPGFRPFE
ncbi:HAD-IB family hydrolase [Flexithrix dorotheae]|uniref:HAD-IB family hydrolase n=1 Tax=Flexithrix dorotheae TaxID=70993 RepID=UPI00036E7070|nr:HAD-IB family hydrolase [Flexithrix dorotheae]